MSSAIFSFFGWTFLPDLVTGKAQDFWYNFTYRAGSPKPQPGTPRWVKHRRRIYIGVILVYLLYTLYEADWNIRRTGDFYSELGVAQDVGERELGSRFRKITLQFHPDKLPATFTPAQRQVAEAQYLHLQLAKDTLTDPAKRFAYDRLGPDITELKHAKTIRDFVIVGGKRMMTFYIGSVIALAGAQWFQVFDTSGAYWRYLTLGVLFLFELRTITSPSPLPITSLATILNPLHSFLSTLHLLPLTSLLTKLFSAPRPAYLPFQSIQLAHRAVFTIFIALSRLAPLFEPPKPRGATTALEAEMAPAVQKLEALVTAYAGDANRLLQLESIAWSRKPERGGNEARAEYAQLKPYLKNFLVTNTIQQEPQVGAALARVLARQRGDDANSAAERVLRGSAPSNLPQIDDETMQDDPKVMEEFGWIASATSPDSSVVAEPKPTLTHDATPHPHNHVHAHTQSHARRPSATPPSAQTSPDPAAADPAPLPPLDPGELADTEGETPGAPSTHTHTHTHNGHQHKHSSHKTSGAGAGGKEAMGASMEMLRESEIREAKREVREVRESEREREGYEGDIDV